MVECVRASSPGPKWPHRTGTLKIIIKRWCGGPRGCLERVRPPRRRGAAERVPFVGARFSRVKDAAVGRGCASFGRSAS